jgi:hypothetical protein
VAAATAQLMTAMMKGEGEGKPLAGEAADGAAAAVAVDACPTHLR